MKKNQEILEIVYQIIGIISGIAIAVFTAIQVNINRKLIEDGRALHQPLFQVRFMDWKTPDSEIYNHTDVVVYNIGEPVKSFENINIQTYIKFQYQATRTNSTKTYYIPIEKYFNWLVPTDSLKGKVALSYNPEPNSSYFFGIYKATIDSVKSPQYAFVQLQHVTTIFYTDKYDVKHQVYFINENAADKNDCALIQRESEKIKCMNPIYIDQLSFSKMMKIIEKIE